MKNFAEKEAWAFPGTAQFFGGTPYYLRNGKSYGFQIWPAHSQGPSEQKPIKNFGEKRAWAYPGTFPIFNPFVTAAYPPAVLAYVKSKKITKKCYIPYFCLIRHDAK